MRVKSLTLTTRRLLLDLARRCSCHVLDLFRDHNCTVLEIITVLY